MTEGSSGQPSTPEQQLVEANPDEPATPEQNQTDSSQNGSSSVAQGPATAGPRRSNEFWLAVAGIAATLIIGAIGSLLAYSASIHQIKAESDRAALSFSREQRKNAYADYLDALAILENEEFKLYDQFTKLPFDMKQAEDQLKAQNDAFLKYNRASSTVRLLATPDVAAARNAIRFRHNDIQTRINNLTNVARTGPPEKAVDLAHDLHDHLDLAPSPLVPHFIDVAKIDIFGPASN